MELRLWKAAGVDVKAAGGDWYRELGQGMGPTLNTAAGMGAYVLADRATWANFKNRQDLAILVEGDARLLNPYGSILVSPAKFPHVQGRSGPRVARVADRRARAEGDRRPMPSTASSSSSRMPARPGAEPCGPRS